MPRHPSSKHESAGSQSHSYSSNQYLSDSSHSATSPVSPTASNTQVQGSAPANPKKKHLCTTCDRGFTTSGHLARHLRVHTGERNHKCPFPGCETRCSRQDNLQQHYRIHLSPGSRRSSSASTRAAIARAVGTNGSGTKLSRSSSSVLTSERDSSDPPSPPPALEQAIPPPPDSPPPLVQAFSVPVYTDSLQSESVSSRSPTPPDNPYPMVGQHSQVTMNGHISSHSSPMPSHYSDSPPSYAEQSHTPSYNYVSTSAVHPSSAARTDIQDPSYEYSHTYEKSPVARIHSSSLHHSQSMDSMHNSQPSHMSSVSSRLSISHISHPQSYPNHYTGAPSPESNHSISSHSQPSGPPTPNYTAYRDDSHESASYQNHQSILEPVVDQSNISSGYMNSQNHLVHGTYSHTLIAQQGLPRYDSPPPILAPIQDERVIRGDPRIPHMHHSTSLPGSMSYMHHSQPHNAYSYQTPRLSLGQGYGSLRGQNTAGFA